MQKLTGQLLYIYIPLVYKQVSPLYCCEFC